MRESAATGSSKSSNLDLLEVSSGRTGPRVQLFRGGDEAEADKGPLCLDLEKKSALKKNKKEICAGVAAAKA